MSTEDPPADRVVVAIQDGVAYLHVVGRGSFKVGGGMKQFGVASIERGCREIVLDMTECTGMDSTFMGVLAGLAFRLKQQPDGGQIHIVNLSTRTLSLLTTLGLDQVVATYMVGETPEAFQPVIAAEYQVEELSGGDSSRAGTARTMLEAHENLVNLTPGNLPKFKDVLSFLREDIRNEELGDSSDA